MEQLEEGAGWSSSGTEASKCASQEAICDLLALATVSDGTAGPGPSALGNGLRRLRHLSILLR